MITSQSSLNPPPHPPIFLVSINNNLIHLVRHKLGVSSAPLFYNSHSICWETLLVLPSQCFKFNHSLPMWLLPCSSHHHLLPGGYYCFNWSSISQFVPCSLYLHRGRVILLTCKPYYFSVHNSIQIPNAQLIGTQMISFPAKLPPNSCYYLLSSSLPSNHTNYFSNFRVHQAYHSWFRCWHSLMSFWDLCSNITSVVRFSLTPVLK